MKRLMKIVWLHEAFTEDSLKTQSSEAIIRPHNILP